MSAAAENLGGGSGRMGKPEHSSIPDDLFPDTLPPVVPALWPAAGTRAAEALAALLTGPVNQADYRRGWRLAAYIQSLKYDGWRILSRAIRRPGCRREIAEYRLDRTDPATAAALAARKGASHG